MSKFKLTQTAAEVQNILNNCNGLKSDAEGNLTVGKNLGVDGKLTLKSLISDTNPDGDITKELGGEGPTLYRHCIRIMGSHGFPADIVSFNLYNTNPAQIKWGTLFRDNNRPTACSGYIRNTKSETPKYYFANYIWTNSDGTLTASCVDENRNEKLIKLDSADYKILDNFSKIF